MDQLWRQGLARTARTALCTWSFARAARGQIRFPDVLEDHEPLGAIRRLRPLVRAVLDLLVK